MGAVAQSAKSAAKYSIGQVLEKLSGEFEDLTPSKLRFLEDQGLITPERTGSGYRKFSHAHIERLRLILTLQRDHYLPLKKIAEILEEVDAGNDPDIPGGSVPRSFSSILQPRQVLTRAELARKAGVAPAFVAEAISAGLLPSAEVFAADAVLQVSALGKLAKRGLTPRHLRSLRLAAEKEAENIQLAVAARTGKKSGPEHYEESLLIAELFDVVRAGVVRQALQRQ